MLKNKRWCLKIFLIICGIIFISSNIYSEAQDSTDMLNKTDHIYGNTIGNIVNKGFIAGQAGWLYFCDYNFKAQRFGLYKMTIDGKERVKLSNDYVNFINIKGEWLYFRSFKDGKLYKIKNNGKKRTKICDDQTGFVYLVDNWLYYKNFSDNKRIYKINIDENKKIKLNDDKVSVFNVDGDWIYYINQSDNDSLYRMRIDGLNKTKIIDEKIDFFIKVSDWIYYERNSDFYTLCKIDIFGNNNAEYEVEDFLFLNVYKDNIIYTSSSGLYRINLNGGKSEKINTSLPDEKNIRVINVINDWIYFRKVTKIRENSKAVAPVIYRIKIDGTGLERITQ